MNIIKNIVESFNNKQHVGFSARKLTAFAFVLFSAYIHVRFVTPDNAIEALLVDAGTALLCLGIITFEQVIKFKNGESDKPQVNQPEHEQQG